MTPYSARTRSLCRDSAFDNTPSTYNELRNGKRNWFVFQEIYYSQTKIIPSFTKSILGKEALILIGWLGRTLKNITTPWTMLIILLFLHCWGLFEWLNYETFWFSAKYYFLSISISFPVKEERFKRRVGCVIHFVSLVIALIALIMASTTMAKSALVSSRDSSSLLDVCSRQPCGHHGTCIPVPPDEYVCTCTASH